MKTLGSGAGRESLQDVLQGGECLQLLLACTEGAAQAEDLWICKGTEAATKGWPGTHAAHF